MVGVIRKRDILAHPYATVQSFGWVVFWRALRAAPRTTFLSLLQAEVPARSALPPCTILDACGDLERGMQRLYQGLHERLGGRPDVAAFFAALAGQESAHCELLQICARLPGAAHWPDTRFAAVRDRVARLQQHVADALRRGQAVADAQAALALVVEVETSEVNDVFTAVLAATDSTFVRALEPFQAAVRDHLAFIVRELGRLAPALARECAARLG